MPKKTVKRKNDIEEKLNYLGLDLEDIPARIMRFEPLEYRVTKTYEEKQYRQYKYVPIKNIQILLTPTNRLEEVERKYKKARPLADYLDEDNEENIIRYTTFLNMLKNMDINEIEKVEEEQEKLKEKLPYKVKFEGNYLWQIYYSEATDKYFMLVPTEDTNTSTFFYLLKKQLENKKDEKIFVPISNSGYSHSFLRKAEFKDIENYLWLFTKDWPLVYEVYDKSGELSIQIVGETEVYEKIKSTYKIKLNSKTEAQRFYKLLKALFILQTEVPSYFTFTTNINKKGELDFYLEDTKIEYENIKDWINEEGELGKQKQEIAQELIVENKEKLEKLKLESAAKEIEYITKEKQISTFLECKKTFFGKFKYYFKYSKKGNRKKLKGQEEVLQEDEELQVENKRQKTTKNKKKEENKTVTIEQLLEIYKEYEKLEEELKNLVMDINALKLKNKNLAKKIENATIYIQEIDNHKKSIFEFWKYSNKDEVSVLPEGEAEEVNIIKKITKVFDYVEDFDKFGKTMDKMQRKILSKEETDSVYITATNLLEILNKVKRNMVGPKDIEVSLKEIKKELVRESDMLENEEFDIFGGISQDSTKVSKINNKNHRELKKDKFNILELTKNSKQIGYRMALQNTIDNIKQALEKMVVTEDIPVYKAVCGERLDAQDINIFNINPEAEIKENVKEEGSKINFYKINLKEGSNAISYSNIIFYDNQNKTLPVGQDLSSKILIDVSKMNLVVKARKKFKVVEIEDEKDDFSEVYVKNVTLFEYDIV